MKKSFWHHITSLTFVAVLSFVSLTTIMPRSANASPNGYMAKYPWSPCVFLVQGNNVSFVNSSMFNTYRSQGYNLTTTYYLPNQNIVRYASNSSELFLKPPYTSESASQCAWHHLSYSEFQKAGGRVTINSYQYYYKYANNPNIYDANSSDYPLSFNDWAFYGYPTPVVR